MCNVILFFIFFEKYYIICVFECHLEKDGSGLPSIVGINVLVQNQKKCSNKFM